MNTNGATKTDEVHSLKLIVNALSAQLTRARMAQAMGQTMFDGDREVDTALGFKSVIRYNDYYSLYRRDQTAKRLVKLPASESWKLPPAITDGESRTHYSKEERDKLGDNLPGDTPFIAALKQIITGPKLFRFLRRVDKLAGIGQYGVLLIGTSSPFASMTGDGFLKQPVGRLRGPDNVIYFRAFGQNDAEIIETMRESNTSDPRYGLPNFYRLNMGNDTAEVHHSRVIHVAEELEGNELYGTPRLEAVFNMLQSLKLVWGAGAEAVWRDALKKYILNIDPQSDFDANDSSQLTNLETKMEEFYHGMKSWLQLQGGTVDTVGPEGVDVTGIFDILISLISGDIPKAVLLGTQAGELASAQQDEKTMARFIAARQQQFCEPDILRPTLDRLIEYGTVPAPEAGEYGVVWQSLFEQDALTEAETRKVNAEAQQIEWDSSYTPPARRLRERYGDEEMDELVQDAIDSDEFKPLEQRNFEPGVAQ